MTAAGTGLANLLIEAGIPAGAFNLNNGDAMAGGL